MMAFRFRAGDYSVERAVRRIAREQIDGALAAIDGKNAHVATHEVRKCCKKVRALIRLVRPGFAGYVQENEAFRDIARGLAGSRDAKVLLDTFDLLAADAQKRADPALFGPLRGQLAHEPARPARGATAEARLGHARTLLAAARERIGGWTLECHDWGAQGAGLRKILRRANKAARTLAREPTARHYHELRKLMKYHWYHTRLLVPVWPAMMQPRAAELSRLADLLGLHHDISVFEERVAGRLEGSGYREVVETLLALALRRRARLEREIGPLVARLLAQAPRALVDHWQALWGIWRAEHGGGEAGTANGQVA
ncbi:CHAD domain-containing protein [Novosphingobium sp. CF614]|nr:CHAD domain-containing protein [Novosphingobium sp. CF614]